MKHPYHCVLCGTQLNELGLGILGCPKCETQFLPTGTDDGEEFSLTWKPKPEDDEHVQWRDLIDGELIHHGDEFQGPDNAWHPSPRSGESYEPEAPTRRIYHAPHRRRVP